MNELTPRELTMDEMEVVGGGVDADRQVPDPSHGPAWKDLPPTYN